MDTRNESGSDQHPAAHRATPERVTSEPPTSRAEGDHEPPRWPRRYPIEPVRLYSVRPVEMAERLRGALGLPPQHPTPGEDAATFGRPMPAVVHGLDVGGWIAWCVAGLPLFGERLSLAGVRREAKRIAATLAMLRAHGNISAAARMLGASRKVLRENLQAAGLRDVKGTARANGSTEPRRHPLPRTPQRRTPPRVP
jgi:Bacterial regulatory protein, Fis family